MVTTPHPSDAWASENSVPKTSRNGPSKAKGDAGGRSGSSDDKPPAEVQVGKDYIGIGAPYSAEDSSPTAFAMRFLHKHGKNVLLAFDKDGRAEIYGTNKTGVWRHQWNVMNKLLSRDTAKWVADGIEKMLDMENPGRRIGELGRWGKHLQTPTGRKDVWAVVGEALGLLDDRGLRPVGITECRDDELDANLRYIGAPNGVIDVYKQKLLTEAEAKSKLVTRCILDSWDPSAKHPDWDKLLSHLDEDQREWLLDACGYALRGLPSRRIYIIEGPPGRGKTSLLTAIRSPLGDASDGGYGFALSPTALVADRFSSANAHSEHLVHFPHGRIATAADLPDRRLDTSLMKNVSGSDSIPTRGMREKSGRSLPAKATLFIALNEGNLHNLDLGDSGLGSRVRLLKYPPMQEEQDLQLIDRVAKNRHCRQAVFAELMRRAAKDTPPDDIPTVIEASAAARVEAAGEIGVLTERIVGGTAADLLTTAELWQAALDDSEAADHRPWGMDRNQLIRRISLLRGLPPAGIHKIGGKNQRGWVGFKLIAPQRFSEE